MRKSTFAINEENTKLELTIDEARQMLGIGRKIIMNKKHPTCRWK